MGVGPMPLNLNNSELIKSHCFIKTLPWVFYYSNKKKQNKTGLPHHSNLQLLQVYTSLRRRRHSGALLCKWGRIVFYSSRWGKVTLISEVWWALCCSSQQRRVKKELWPPECPCVVERPPPTSLHQERLHLRQWAECGSHLPLRLKELCQ